MRFKGVASGLGIILLIFPISLLLPFITGLLYREGLLVLVVAYILPGVFTFSIGFFLYTYGRKRGGNTKDLRPVEALVIVALTWVLIALIGALPFMLINALPNFVDAFFESMSGFTTTGSSVITEIDPLPRSILLWRALTQWIGGLGVIVLMVAIFSVLIGGQKAGMLLMKGEVPGHSSEKLVPRLKDTAKILWGIYALLTLIEIVLLTILGVSLYDAVCHSFTTLSTGGYGTHTASIAFYENYAFAPLIEVVIVIFMMLGSINFVLFYNILKGRPKTLFKDAEFRIYILVLFVMLCIVSMDLMINDIYGPLESIRASLFNVTSIYSTCGYATKDFGQWPALSQFIMVVAMLMGGMTGSTSGAIKTARFIIAGKAVSRSLKRIGHPKATIPLRVGSVIFNERIVRGVGIFIFGYLAIFVFASFVMTLVGLDPVSALSSVSATMGGVGPGLGMVGPGANFADVNVPGKLILSFLMWFGRLEMITGLVLFFPSTYKM